MQNNIDYEKDVKMIFRIKNNILWQLMTNYMQRKKIPNLTYLIKYYQFPHQIYGYLSFSQIPFTYKSILDKTYDLKSSARIILTITNYKGDPLKVFPPNLYANIIVNKIEIDTNSDQILSLDDPNTRKEVLKLASGDEETIQHKVENDFLKEKIKEILKYLSLREAEIIKMRFGLLEYEGETHTLDEVGKRFGITRERVRQTEAKILEKIRNNTIAKSLIS